MSTIYTRLTRIPSPEDCRKGARGWGSQPNQAAVLRQGRQGDLPQTDEETSKTPAKTQQNGGPDPASAREAPGILLGMRQSPGIQVRVPAVPRVLQGQVLQQRSRLSWSRDLHQIPPSQGQAFWGAHRPAGPPEGDENFRRWPDDSPNGCAGAALTLNLYFRKHPSCFCFYDCE